MRRNHKRKSLSLFTVPIAVEEHMKMKKLPSVADAEGEQALFGYLNSF
jgi:hypothetical protein